MPFRVRLAEVPFPRVLVSLAGGLCDWPWGPFGRWKVHEACMLALGSVKSIVTDSVKSGRIPFDRHGFLTGVVLADLNLSGVFQHSRILGVSALLFT